MVNLQRSGNLSSVMTGFAGNMNLVSFVLGKVCVAHSGQL